MSEFCEKCGREITDPDGVVWLEYRTRTDTWHLENEIDPEDSQGAFAFGKRCALQILENGGRNE